MWCYSIYVYYSLNRIDQIVLASYVLKKLVKKKKITVDHNCCDDTMHTPTLPAVQDVAFQLERLVAGMYVYYRQCHKIMKPACVFPIEVELGINLDPSRYESHDPVVSHDESHDVDKPDENGDDDLLLPSLALPTDELTAHPQMGVDDLLSLPQTSEP